MANVQTENGYFKVANRLAEAILAAPFSGQQVRILLAILRLTYGWRRRTVRITETELARYAGMAPGPDTKFNRAGGTFRAALDALVKHGVVRRVDGNRGSRQCTYALQKNFTQWGDYSIAEARLESVWADRPESDDDALRASVERDEADDDKARGQATSDDEEQGQTRPEVGPRSVEEDGPTSGHVEAGENTTWPEVGPLEGPKSGHVDGSKSLFDETVQGPKDRKDSVVGIGDTDHPTKPPTPGGGEQQHPSQKDHNAIFAYASALTKHANAARDRRFGQQTRSINTVTAMNLAEDLIAANVPLEFAKAVIDSTVDTLSAEPADSYSTVEYFRKPLTKALRKRAGDSGITVGETTGNTPGDRSYDEATRAFDAFNAAGGLRIA